MICRDRGTAYAQAARDAAPGAAQVADRWHIWDNLCGHARKAVARHQDCLAAPPEPEPGPGPGLLRPLTWRRPSAGGTRRCTSCAPPARTQAQAAAALGLSLQLTGRYWRAATADALLAALAARSTSALDPYKPHPRACWDSGFTSIAALLREITAQGYRGGYTTIYAWLGQLKLAAPPRPPAPPAARQAAGGSGPTPPPWTPPTPPPWPPSAPAAPS